MVGSLSEVLFLLLTMIGKEDEVDRGWDEGDNEEAFRLCTALQSLSRVSSRSRGLMLTRRADKGACERLKSLLTGGKFCD